MPRIELYEPAQMNFMKHYSILDENGKEKPESEKQQIAFQLISVLNSTKDLKELRKMG